MEIPNGQQEEPVQFVSPNEAANGTAVISHGGHWNTSTVDAPLNGTVGTKLWSVTGLDGQIVHESNLPTAMRSLVRLQWMFPTLFLSTIVHNTDKIFTAVTYAQLLQEKS